MGLINYLIVAIDNTGYRGWIYQGWIVVAYLVVAAFNLFWRRHYGYKWFRTLLITLAFLLSFELLYLLLGWALNGFHEFGYREFVTGYAFVPILAMGIGRVFKDNWRKLLDFMTPGFSLALATIKISCCIAGCCFGFPFAHGMWNPIFKQNLFPIQLVEMALGLLFVYILMYIARKKEYDATGTLYAWFMILYGTARFFTEFAHVNIKLVLGISIFGFWALATAIVGAVWLILDNRKQRQIAEAETEVETETEAEEAQD